jgi:hypothetical protein
VPDQHLFIGLSEGKIHLPGHSYGIELSISTFRQVRMMNLVEQTDGMDSESFRQW